MEFVIARDHLATLLSKAVSTVSQRDVQPILKNFLIKAADKQISVMSTDLSLGAIAETPLNEIQTPGMMAAPATKLYEMTGAAPDGFMRFVLEGNTLTIQTNYKKQGEKETWTNKWTLHCMDPDLYPEFPSFKEANSTKVDREQFVEALNKVSFSIADNELRLNLMAVYVNNGFIYASDGHRTCRLEFDSNLSDVMIPRAAVKLLVRILRDSEIAQIELSKSEYHLLFRVGKNIYHSRRLEQSFPDIESKVFKKSENYEYTLGVKRKVLRDAVRRAAITASENHILTLTYLPDEKQVFVKSADETEDSSEEYIDVTWSGPVFEKAINYEYLEDVLKVLKNDDVVIKMTEDKGKRRSFYRFEEKHPDTKQEFVAIILPMRITKAGEDAMDQAKGKDKQSNKKEAEPSKEESQEAVSA